MAINKGNLLSEKFVSNLSDPNALKVLSKSSISNNKFDIKLTANPVSKADRTRERIFKSRINSKYLKSNLKG